MFVGRGIQRREYPCNNPTSASFHAAIKKLAKSSSFLTTKSLIWNLVSRSLAPSEQLPAATVAGGAFTGAFKVQAGF